LRSPHSNVTTPSPNIIEAIAEGRVPANLTVTRLVRNLPTAWANQEKQLGFA
jgi:hypothetical protein